MHLSTESKQEEHYRTAWKQTNDWISKRCRGLIDRWRRHIAIATSTDEDIAFGGNFHSKSTNIREENRKNTAEQHKNAHMARDFSDVEDCAI